MAKELCKEFVKIFKLKSQIPIHRNYQTLCEYKKQKTFILVFSEKHQKKITLIN